MDIRLASDTREDRASSSPGAGSCRRPARAGSCRGSWASPRRSEWVLSGRVFPAAEALDRRAGAQRPPRRRAAARRPTPSRARSPTTQRPSRSRSSRQLLWRMLGADHPMEAHRADSRGIYLRGQAGDVREGVGAFLEKRDPEFPDRVSTDLPDIFPGGRSPSTAERLASGHDRIGRDGAGDRRDGVPRRVVHRVPAGAGLRRAHDRAGSRARGRGARDPRGGRGRSGLAARGAWRRISTSDAGWPEAVAGCRYVLHVASPFPPVQPKDPDELIVPARDGALRVLRAALDAGVERVVMTSSIAAIRSDARVVLGRALHRGRLDRRQRPRAHALHPLQDDRRAGRVGARAGSRGRGPPGDDQPRRHHRPGAQRRPLLLAPGDPAAARRGARDAQAGVHVRGRPRRRRPPHPRDDRPGRGRRALHRHRSVPVDGRRRGRPARAPGRRRREEGPDPRRAQPGDPR